MKKLLLTSLLTSLLLFGNGLNLMAQEQTIDNVNSKLGLNIEKADPSTDVKQAIKNERSWFLINVVINGKIQEKVNKCQPEVND